VSLRTDDELSKFEHVLLGAHLAVCRDCRRFADDVRWQTESIRSTPLERMSHSVTIPTRHSWRRPALGVSTAAVAASILALAIGLRGPSTTHAPAQSPQVNRATPALSEPGDTNGLHRGSLSTSDQNVGTFRGDPVGAS
jgi:hypothetical protein